MRYFDFEGTYPVPPFIQRQWKRMMKQFTKPMTKKRRKQIEDAKIFSQPADTNTSKDWINIWK